MLLLLAVGIQSVYLYRNSSVGEERILLFFVCVCVMAKCQ